MIKCIVFDFDGTLADSKELSIKVINELAIKYEFEPLTMERIEHLRKYSIIERCRELKFPIHKIPFAMKDFIQIYKQSVQQLTLFEGIKSLLLQLKEEGYELAIISSNTKEVISNMLKNNDVTLITDIFSEKNIFGKDKSIKKFMKLKKLSTDEILYVGDELRDVVACNKIGVKVTWVSWGFDLEDVFVDIQPTYIAHKPEDLLTIVKKGVER